MRRPRGLIIKTVLALFFVLSIYDFIQARRMEIFPFASKVSNLEEDYDPSLARLNSEKAFLKYTDSQYRSLPIAEQDSAAYALIIGNVGRKRFYHEFLTYEPGSNFLAWIVAKVSGRAVNEVWVPDHILKSGKAICGQQSVVVMSALKERGFRVRAVYFDHPIFGGHFALETYYSGDWHFFDPDIEPDSDVLLSKNRPSIAELTKDTALLIKAYKHRNSEEMVKLFSSYRYGSENELVSSSMYSFQLATNWLSQTLWIFILAGWLIFLKRKALFFAFSSKPPVLNTSTATQQ